MQKFRGAGGPERNQLLFLVVCRVSSFALFKRSSIFGRKSCRKLLDGRSTSFRSPKTGKTAQSIDFFIPGDTTGGLLFWKFKKDILTKIKKSAFKTHIVQCTLYKIASILKG